MSVPVSTGSGGRIPVGTLAAGRSRSVHVRCGSVRCGMEIRAGCSWATSLSNRGSGTWDHFPPPVVTSVNVMLDRETDRSRGLRSSSSAHRGGAKKAVEQFSLTGDLGGRQLTVNIARPGKNDLRRWILWWWTRLSGEVGGVRSEAGRRGDGNGTALEQGPGIVLLGSRLRQLPARALLPGRLDLSASSKRFDLRGTS